MLQKKEVTSRRGPGVYPRVHQQEHKIQFIVEHSFVLRYCEGSKWFK